MHKTKSSKERRKSKFLGLNEKHPVDGLFRNHYFSHLCHLDPEYYEIEFQKHGITRCTKAYLFELTEKKPILLKYIKKFEKNYSLPKSFAQKCDLFEIRTCVDLKT